MSTPEAATTKVFGITHNKPGVTPDQIAAHMRAEAAVAWRLYLQGAISENYFRTDGHGTVTVFNATTVDEAAEYGNQFPLVQAGLIEFEYHAVGAFVALGVLMT